MRPAAKPWVAARIAANLRAAREATCAFCGQPVFAGPDSDVAALDVTVDREAVGPAGELRALMAGGSTYDRVGPDLYQRDPSHVRGHPAGTGKYPVHATHRCEESAT